MRGGSAEQAGKSSSQLTPGRYASLCVDVAQVKRDSPTGDEQLPAHLGVGSTGGDQPRDRELLMGEVEGGAPARRTETSGLQQRIANREKGRGA